MLTLLPESSIYQTDEELASMVINATAMVSIKKKGAGHIKKKAQMYQHGYCPVRSYLFTQKRNRIGIEVTSFSSHRSKGWKDSKVNLFLGWFLGSFCCFFGEVKF